MENSFICRTKYKNIQGMDSPVLGYCYSWEEGEEMAGTLAESVIFIFLNIWNKYAISVKSATFRWYKWYQLYYFYNWYCKVFTFKTRKGSERWM